MRLKRFWRTHTQTVGTVVFCHVHPVADNTKCEEKKEKHTPSAMQRKKEWFAYAREVKIACEVIFVAKSS